MANASSPVNFSDESILNVEPGKTGKRVGGHGAEIRLIFETLKQLLHPPQPPMPRIGFRRMHDDGPNGMLMKQ